MFTARLLLLSLAAGSGLLAQRHELALTVGRVLSQERQALALSGGAAVQFNYGMRLAGGDGAALYGEVALAAIPLRDVTARILSATRDFASLYLSPGLRVKVAPRSRFSPYAAFGAGWSWYEQSTQILSGGPNPAPRHVHSVAFMFGGGVDVPVWRWLAARAEIRDFYTGSPAFNTEVGGRQHNPVLTAGLVLRLGR